MTKKPFFRLGILGLVGAIGFVDPAPAFAASSDECAIWLCLPGGFPSGCGAAKSAMRKRVKKGKSPLPSFSSCAVNSTVAGLEAKDGRAARIGNGDKWLKDTRCRNVGGRSFPRGCTGNGWYAEVFIDGVQEGETYFFTP